MSLNKNQILRIFNLRRFGPRLSFIANKFIITKNYSVSHFVGDHENMVSFASHVQQLSLGALFCNFNKYNFYSKKHPYFENFSIINDKRNSFFSFFKKRFRFFYFDRPETDFFKRSDYFSNSENDFPLKESQKINYINSIHNFNKNYLFHKLKIKKNIDIDRDTLVIHVRTGDVFNNNWHSLYSQNPLSYFLKISENYQKVLIISGKDQNNPVLKLLKQYKKFSFQSASFIDDFNVLLNARNLASSGVSGFPIVAALMSQKIENFYHSDLYLKEHLNPEMLDKNQVTIHSYKIIDGIQPMEFKKTDKNLSKLMDDDITKIIRI
jgi:hypothetical protein